MSVETTRTLRDRIVAPLWNRTENRPRALWRAVGALVAGVVAITVGGVATSVVDAPTVLESLAAQGVAAALVVALVVVWARLVDRRPVAAYGLALDRRWLGGAALGFAVGTLGWGGALATSLLAGWARVDGLFVAGATFPFGVGMVLWSCNWLLVGVWEELLFRGLLLRNAVEGLRGRRLSDRAAAVGGLLVTSLVFGVLHADQAGSVLALGFWTGAGVVLGVAYLLTDSLAVPIGLHVAFDLAVNDVFGLSRVRPTGERLPTIVAPEFTGPDRLVDIAGWVNSVWLVAIGLGVVLAAAWYEGGLRLRLSRYESR